MMRMLEIKDKRNTWWKLLKIGMYHLWETNNRSLPPRDVFFLLVLFIYLFFGGGGDFPCALSRKTVLGNWATFWLSAHCAVSMLVEGLHSLWAQF